MPTIKLDRVAVTVDAPTTEDPRGRRTILQPTTLTLDEHRIGIIGANGSGKSTFARLINGLISPSEGTITVDGRSPTAARSRIGFVFSDADNQIIMPRVVDDVAFSLRRRGLSKTERRAQVDAALERFGLGELAEASPHSLSGGQKQLLALASVLVVEPELIIADEPTTLLDLRNRHLIARELAELEQQVITVTHDLDLLCDADRVLCLDGGRVVDDGAPGPVISAYRRRMAP